MSLGAIDLRQAVEAYGRWRDRCRHAIGEVFVNAAARRCSDSTDRTSTPAYLKDTVGFYPFDLAAGRSDGQPIREEVRIGERVLHSVVTRCATRRALGAIVILRDPGDTATSRGGAPSSRR
jgi:hypothetical protein